MIEPWDFSRFRRRRIQLFSRLRLKNVFPGEWESVYAGEGIEFKAVRSLESGDDLRDLDLHTLAQSGDEEIVERVAGRQMKIYVWVDLSGSMLPSTEMFFPEKPETRGVTVGLLLFSACNAYSPVGLCGFAQGIRKFFPPSSGEAHCWQILNWMIHEEHRSRPGVGANFQNALSFMIERVPPQSLVFLLSDFQDDVFRTDFTSLLERIVKKVDLVPVIIRDSFENKVLKRRVRVAVEDSEGFKRDEIYLSPQVLDGMKETSEKHLSYLKTNFRRAGSEPVVLDSPSIEGCDLILSGFFSARRRSRR